jgi:hypothetical protein
MKKEKKRFTSILNQLELDDIKIFIDDADREHDSYFILYHGIHYYYQHYREWDKKGSKKDVWRLWVGLALSKGQYATSLLKKFPKLKSNSHKYTIDLKFPEANGFTPMLREDWPKWKTHWVGAYLETPNPDKLTDSQMNDVADLILSLKDIKDNLGSSKSHGKAATKSYIRRLSGIHNEIAPLHDKLEARFTKFLLDKKEIGPGKRIGDIDLWYRSNTGNVICELKPTADSVNIRYAIGQLIDYRCKYKNKIKGPELKIVLGEKPRNGDIEILRSIQREIPISLAYWEKKDQTFKDISFGKSEH